MEAIGCSTTGCGKSANMVHLNKTLCIDCWNKLRAPKLHPALSQWIEEYHLWQSTGCRGTVPPVPAIGRYADHEHADIQLVVDGPIIGLVLSRTGPRSSRSWSIEELQDIVEWAEQLGLTRQEP